MYIADLTTQVQPFVNLFTSLILSGAGVTMATQILKWQVIPIPATTHPRLVAGIASLVASAIVAFVSAATLPISGFVGWAAFSMGVYLLAAMIYNHIVYKP